MKVFGRNPTGARLERILRASNYGNGVFSNVEPTKVMSPDSSFMKIMKEFNANRRHTKPPTALPHQKTDLKQLKDDQPVIVWFGHSSYFISYNGFRVLVDPVFSGNASPVRFFGKQFEGTGVYQPEDFPMIDLLVLTHDHYDHLDYKTILRLKDRVKHIVCSLGLGAHLDYWGINAVPVTELNWWEQAELSPAISITATPARHFTGRLFKRAQTLWSSFVLQLFDQRLFIGGDSGYDKQFKVIGDKFGPFRLAFLECGQYGENWPNIHMFPEQTVSAARDLRADMLFPVHWAKFALANHPWNESILRLRVEASKQQQPFVSPMIGQPYTLGEKFEQTDWWEL